VDLRYVQTPIKWFLFKSESSGFFSLWTENIGCGYPIHAYGEGGLLYPLNWFIYPFLPVSIAHDVTLMLHLFIAGIGMLFLGRHYHTYHVGSLVSAVVYTFSGWMSIHFGHLNSVQVSAWIPWAFLALDMNRHMLKSISAVWLGLSISMMFLAGRPQITFYAWIALLIHAILHVFGKEGSVRFLIILGLGTILGLLLASPQVLPTFEFANLSSRSDGIAFKDQLVGTVSWSQLFWVIAPLWNKKDTFGVSSESIGYIGMTTGLLLVISFLHVKKRFYAGWWVMLIVTLILSTGESFPLNTWIYQLPGFAYFRTPARWLCVSIFSMSMLSGYGVTSIIEIFKNNRLRNLLGILIALVIFYDLNFFIHPVVLFIDRRVQETVPQAVPVLSGGGRYLNLNTSPIFVRELENNKIAYRHYAAYFSAREALNDNLGMRYSLHSIQSYTGLHLQWTERALTQITQKGLSAMNCEFVISSEPLQGTSLTEAWKNRFFYVYRNEDVEPRAKLAALIAPDEGQGFVSSGDVQGSARIIKDTSQQELTIEVQTEAPGYLILADTFYPGWKVWVNGIEKEVIRVNGWMRAVSVPTGMSTVRFLYQSITFLWGLGIALIGILVTILGTTAWYRKGRKTSGIKSKTKEIF